MEWKLGGYRLWLEQGKKNCKAMGVVHSHSCNFWGLIVNLYNWSIPWNSWGRMEFNLLFFFPFLPLLHIICERAKPKPSHPGWKLCQYFTTPPPAPFLSQMVLGLTEEGGEFFSTQEICSSCYAWWDMGVSSNIKSCQISLVYCSIQ